VIKQEGGIDKTHQGRCGGKAHPILEVMLAREICQCHERGKGRIRKHIAS